MSSTHRSHNTEETKESLEGEILDDTDARTLGLGIMLIVVGLFYLFGILPG
jgi:hypothetical protein